MISLFYKGLEAIKGKKGTKGRVKIHIYTYTHIHYVFFIFPYVRILIFLYKNIP
nr:MAG TPA: hypothetical protein [Caudoviricetes sp.]